MATLQLDKLSFAVQERLAFIEFRLWFMGELRRADIIERFWVGPAVATRDLAQYRGLAPDNIEFEGSGKLYRQGKNFTPLFEHPLPRVLSLLSLGFGDGLGGYGGAMLPCEYPSSLNRPALSVLATVSRAIHLQKPLTLQYHSTTSGLTEREIVPFALVDNGLRWHVRAYDRKRQEFRDFVITRMINPVVQMDGIFEAHERPDQDIQWSRIVELDLVPHPDQPRPKIAELDYGMEGGVLHVKVRAAMAGYMLRRWSVDCSPDHSLRGPEYRLWLKDHLALYGVKNAVLAPGYVEPGARN
ncbi:Predicted DNA-binding transcriptional regulator YafY, contains an HTH and WYL domains [Formivibrio citricus]|uniref:Predicted DNA-binding transcriptional regulator YafY, contains an HTH and WYL domains n=1 Tax=Formivibrio citricus TaxID=83765 RepID=A0A1I4Z2J8_9NEIS|nr:WYL domain-containing protein [Formivibrio citricus]SFN44428.1 Predicted DNA-binding transcriptional regulator YafY, contains an HTH and WYL domains [Formivibrio citricus]